MVERISSLIQGHVWFHQAEQVIPTHLFHAHIWVTPPTKSAMSWYFERMIKENRNRSSYWHSHLHMPYSVISLVNKLNLKSNSGHLSTLKPNYTSLTVDSPAQCTPHFKGNLCCLCHNLNILANLRWFTFLCFDFQGKCQINTILTFFYRKPWMDESQSSLNSKRELICLNLFRERLHVYRLPRLFIL